MVISRLIKLIEIDFYRLSIILMIVAITVCGCSYAEEDDHESYYMFYNGQGINGDMQRAFFASSPSQCVEHVGANGPVDVTEPNITPYLHITVLFPHSSVDPPTCLPIGKHSFVHNINNSEYDYLECGFEAWYVYSDEKKDLTEAIGGEVNVSLKRAFPNDQLYIKYDIDFEDGTHRKGAWDLKTCGHPLPTSYYK